MAILYAVATPIGNLEDISLRALRILKEVDFIICEDTRVTSKLLAHYEIQKSLVSYFQHSHLSRVEEIIERLKRGQNAALVTDAGTPGISDPGGVLIKLINEKLGSEIKIVPLPGPCAAMAALSISGVPTDKFLFLGFPPHKKGRQTYWRRVLEAKETVVFYESCHRIVKALQELQKLLHGHLEPSREISHANDQENDEKIPRLAPLARDDNERQLVVCRELTKMFESVYRGTIDEVLEQVKTAPQKGEYVVVISNS